MWHPSTARRNLGHHQSVDLSRLCPAAEVVLVSAAPLDPHFPGGFAERHSAFASAVAHRHPTELIYIHDGDDAMFRNVSLPKGLTNVHIVGAPPATGWDHPRIPRQSVGRNLRCVSSGERPLVVTLTANVAHIALRCLRAIVVMEEGWERALPSVDGSPLQTLHWLAERLRYRSIYRRIGRSALHTVAITPREGRHFAQFMPENRISVIPFGVDTEFFKPISVAERDIDVLVVGALNRAEQHAEDLVTELLRRPETRNARCVLVGGSPRASVLALASRTVEVTGYVSDVRPYYARAKVVAIPTFTDIGIKTTMLHAWAMERPVVTSESVLAASENGMAQARLAVPTVEAMAPVIARLIGDAEERERLGRLARLIVLAHHEERRSAQQFARLVDEALT